MVKINIKIVFCYLISISTAMAVVTACVYIGPTNYPATWGDTIYFDNNNIHLLEGTYSSTGDHAYHSEISEGSPYTSLPHLLFAAKPTKIIDNPERYTQSDSVSFEIVNERDILIKVYKNGKINKEKILRDDQFSIKKGWLTIESSGIWAATGAIELEKYLYQIRVNDSGDLIFKNSSSSFGLLVILPMTGYDERWFRFKRKRLLIEQ